jgi:DNA-binding NarL/FixJ family response regulator
VPSEARDADESSASARGRVVTPQRGAGARVAGRRFVLHDGLYFCTTRQTFLDVGSTVIRILIVDGHLVVRDALATVLGAVRGLLIVGKAASIRQTVPLLEHTVPDLLLADLCLQDGSGIELARMLRRSCSKTRALIMAGFRDEFYAAEALAAGVSGYVLKAQPTSDLLAAIETVSRGETMFLRPSPPASAPLFASRAMTTRSADFRVANARSSGVWWLARAPRRYRRVSSSVSRQSTPIAPTSIASSASDRPPV